MTRIVFWMLFAGSLAGCGDSPASPTTSTGFPDIRGTWIGSRTVNARLDDDTTTNNVCAERWTIATQSDGFFAGSFETGGAPCLQQAGTVEGTITMTGTIATFSINTTLGQGGPCVVVALSSLTGGFLGATVNMGFSDEISCSSGSATFRSTRRTVSMTLMRQ
jgi:hypothetical protein